MSTDHEHSWRSVFRLLDRDHDAVSRCDFELCVCGETRSSGWKPLTEAERQDRPHGHSIRSTVDRRTTVWLIEHDDRWYEEGDKYVRGVYATKEAAAAAVPSPPQRNIDGHTDYCCSVVEREVEGL